MSIISGDMEPKSPQWLEAHRLALEELGYTYAAPEDSGNEYARQNDEVGLEYLSLYLNDQDQAIEAIPDYFRRFGDINRSASILSRLTPDQFGLIVNIASLRYDPDTEEDRALAVYSKVDKYLANKNSANIGGYTSQIRKPELLRDLAAHWVAGNWPYTNDYSHFLRGNTDWHNVNEQIALKENNQLMFAISIPRAATDPLIRANFRETYPELSQQGIDILAAGLFNRGAHDEHLREAYPDMADRYKGWEDSIYAALDTYGKEYRHEISVAIAEAKWHVFNDKEFNFPGLPEKLLNTSFSLGEFDELVRNSD